MVKSSEANGNNNKGIGSVWSIELQFSSLEGPAALQTRVYFPETNSSQKPIGTQGSPLLLFEKKSMPLRRGFMCGRDFLHLHSFYFPVFSFLWSWPAERNEIVVQTHMSEERVSLEVL